MTHKYNKNCSRIGGCQLAWNIKEQLVGDIYERNDG